MKRTILATLALAAVGAAAQAQINIGTDSAGPAAARDKEGFDKGVGAKNTIVDGAVGVGAAAKQGKKAEFAKKQSLVEIATAQGHKLGSKIIVNAGHVANSA